MEHALHGLEQALVFPDPNGSPAELGESIMSWPPRRSNVRGPWRARGIALAREAMVPHERRAVRWFCATRRSWHISVARTPGTDVSRPGFATGVVVF